MHWVVAVSRSHRTQNLMIVLILQQPESSLEHCVSIVVQGSIMCVHVYAWNIVDNSHHHSLHKQSLINLELIERWSH